MSKACPEVDAGGVAEVEGGSADAFHRVCLLETVMDAAGDAQCLMVQG